jgi:ferredoxin
LSETTTEGRTLARSEVDALLAAITADGYRLIGPRRRDGAIVCDEIASAADLPAGYRDVQAPGSYRLERRDDEALFGYVVGPHSFRRLFHVPEERLVRLRRKGASFESLPVDDAPPRKLALIGARACEISALGVQDAVFRDGDVADPRYSARRSDVLVVAVSCNEPGGTCFCASMDTGPVPRGGYDLSLTELLPDERGGHRFVVAVGSEAGARLLATVTTEEVTAQDGARCTTLAAAAAAAMGRKLDTDGIKEALYAAAEHPQWEKVADRCLSCTNCTLVCPTCFCSRVDDTTSLDGQVAERTRRWDSCFSLDYSYMHGGPARSSVGARYRHWLTHKLASWHDQFGSSGCVGCGRCITWCPAGIDITEEVAAIRAEPEASSRRKQPEGSA